MNRFITIELVVVVVVTAVIALVQVAITRRRRMAFEAWARRSRFSYRQGPIPAKDVAPLQLFKKPTTVESYEAYNLSSGERGRDVAVFDLRGVGQGDAGDKWYTCALFQFRGLRLARFSFVRAPVFVPGSLGERLHKLAVGKSGHDFEGSQRFAFNDHPGLELHSADLGATKKLFPASMVASLAERNWRLEGEGSFVLVSRERVKPEQLDEFLDESLRMAERFRILFNAG